MKKVILLIVLLIGFSSFALANGGWVIALSDVFFLFENWERYTENDIVFAYRQGDWNLKIWWICVEWICKTDYVDIVEIYKIVDKNTMNQIWSSFNNCLDVHNKVLDNVYLFNENRYSTRNLCSDGWTSMLELINWEFNWETIDNWPITGWVFAQIEKVLENADLYELLDRWDIGEYPIDLTNTLGSRYQQKIWYDLARNEVVFFTDYFYSP